ncbi:MAG: uracil-DNA glycosylase family protein [Candidatus Micrarchaeaceae archaeon]
MFGFPESVCGGKYMKSEYSAGAFVYKKSKGRTLFLVLKRGIGRRGVAGTPDLPKGHIENGEDAKAAAIREIREETGIEPAFLPFFKEDTAYAFRDNGELIRKKLTLFICDSGRQRVRISREHSGYEWMGYEKALRAIPFSNIRKLLQRVNEYINRWEEMKVLNRRYAKLPDSAEEWHLSRNFVPGEGRLDSKFMLIGQAPGLNEDLLLRPFIGRSGRLLEMIINETGMKRSDFYITSVVQFFPPRNRLPSKAELELCKPLLLRQIGIIKPKVVITLGDFASSSVLGMGKISETHGRIVSHGGITYMATFHPAAALRSTRTLRLIKQDFKKLKRVARGA